MQKIEKNIYFSGTSYYVIRMHKGERVEKKFDTLEEAREFLSTLVTKQPKIKYKTDGDTTTLYIKHKGEVLECLIDTDFLPVALRYKWRYMNGYLHCQEGLLHRMVVGAGEGKIVKHINGNKLDNRKSNLMVLDPSKAKMGKSRYSNNTTGIAGMTYNPKTGLYQARLRHKGKLVYNKTSKNKEKLAKEFEEFKKIFFSREELSVE